jgi:hypothetical protein
LTEIVAVGGLVAVAELAEYRASRWARRAHVYDWAADPQARADLYRDEALDALARAVVERPGRVQFLLGRDERLARATLGYPNVFPLRSAGSAMEGAEPA